MVQDLGPNPRQSLQRLAFDPRAARQVGSAWPIQVAEPPPAQAEGAQVYAHLQ